MLVITPMGHLGQTNGRLQDAITKALTAYRLQPFPASPEDPWRIGATNFDKVVMKAAALVHGTFSREDIAAAVVARGYITSDLLPFQKPAAPPPVEFIAPPVQILPPTVQAEPDIATVQWRTVPRTIETITKALPYMPPAQPGLTPIPAVIELPQLVKVTSTVTRAEAPERPYTLILPDVEPEAKSKVSGPWIAVLALAAAVVLKGQAA